MDIAIAVEGLGKRYRLQQAGYRSLREDLMAGLRGLVRPGGGAEAGELWAVRDLTFSVGCGERLGIIGRNGAGKSTLLRLLARITPQTCGSIALRGRVAGLLEVGTGFHPELTGRENIRLNGAIMGMGPSELAQRFDRIVEFAGVARFLDTPLKRWSSGMQIRLGFSVAAHLSPDILILDEVLAVGDAEFQQRCLQRVREVSSEGRTVLLVSHDLGAISRWCDRAIWLDHGRLACEPGPAEAVVASYLASVTVPGAAEWRPEQPPGDGRFRLLGMRILGDPACCPNDRPLRIALTGEIAEPDPRLQLGIAVSGGDGQLLFWTTTTDVEQAGWPGHPAGTWTWTVELPPHLLNEGTYLVEPLASSNNCAWIIAPGSARALSFTVDGGLSPSTYWQARRPGLLAPVLPWTRSPAAPT